VYKFTRGIPQVRPTTNNKKQQKLPLQQKTTDNTKNTRSPTLPIYPFCPHVTPTIRDNRWKLGVDIWAINKTQNNAYNTTNTLTKQNNNPQAESKMKTNPTNSQSLL